MIKLGGIDFELATLAPNPKFGYTYEYVEKKMISGRIRRIYKGRRAQIELSYGYLTDEQISNLDGLIRSQLQNGYVSVEIDMPKGEFIGEANITINNLQSRYAYINKKWVWTNYEIIITGTTYMKEE